MARTWEHPNPHPVHGPLFKVLHENGVAEYSGAQWDITKIPGAWMKCAKGPLVQCHNGVHVCRESDIIYWIGAGGAIYPVEVAGRVVAHGETGETKLVARRARIVGGAIPTWNARTQRLFAADCAEQALPAFEANFRNDTRPREAIAAARKFANGEILVDALAAADSAAHYAADSAAHSAAYSAAYSAAHYAAHSAAHYAAHYAADSAAYSAAHYAAHSAAYYAAHHAAREWQSRRLLQYIYGEIE